MHSLIIPFSHKAWSFTADFGPDSLTSKKVLASSLYPSKKQVFCLKSSARRKTGG